MSNVTSFFYFFRHELAGRKFEILVYLLTLQSILSWQIIWTNSCPHSCRRHFLFQPYFKDWVLQIFLIAVNLCCSIGMRLMGGRIANLYRE